MTIERIKKKRLGRLISEDWILLLKANMNRFANMYEVQKTNNLEAAIQNLRIAVSRPSNVRLYLNRKIDRLGLQYVQDSIVEYGLTTFDELVAYFIPVETFAKNLIDGYLAETMTYDEISAAIRNKAVLAGSSL